MDSRRLEIFLKILETRSLSKTAAALGMAQPSVSASLKALEDSLGQKLFERTPRSVKALPQAYVLESYARSVLDTLAEAAWALGSQSGGPKEALTIGASSMPALVFMPEVLAAFNARYPNVDIKLKTGKSQSILRRISDGEFDLGVVGERHAVPELSSTAIATDQLCLLATAELVESVGRLPEKLEDLVSWPLIMRDDGSGTKAFFLKAFSKRTDLAAQLTVVAEAEGLLPTLALARSGMGAVIISSLVARAPWLLSSMRLIPLPFMGSERKFYLVRGKSRQLSPAAKELVGIIKNVCAADK